MKYIKLSNEEMIFLNAYNKAGEQTKKWVDAILRADLQKGTAKKKSKIRDK